MKDFILAIKSECITSDEFLVNSITNVFIKQKIEFGTIYILMDGKEEFKRYHIFLEYQPINNLNQSHCAINSN